MKLLIINLFLLISLSEGMNLRWFEYQLSKEIDAVDESEVEWKKFKMEHNKKYGRETEENLRKAVFLDNLNKINEHNKLYDQGLKSFSMGVNQYADLTLREFVSTMNGLQGRRRSNESSTYLSPNVNLDIPDAVDWRKHGGMVSEVKDQGSCGSCWAFSTTGSLEGQMYRKTGKTSDLSEQNLVDCSTEFDNNGCRGGLMTNAFKYIKANKGIDTEESYPYEGRDRSCRFKKEYVGGTVTGYVELPEDDEEKLKEAVASVGPISVAIDANHNSFMFYKKGIYNEPRCSQSELDHGVLAVGYGSEGGEDYWIVKNSWGTRWGEGGYVRMTRNKDNQCGIASMSSYPLV